MINDYVGVLQVAILEATVWSKMATGKSSKPSLADSVSPVISKLSQLWAGRKFGKSKLQAPSGLPKSSGLSSGPVLKPSQPSPEPPAPAESVAELENLLVEALEPLGIHLHLSTSRKIALLWLYAVSLLRCDVRKPWSFHLSSTTQLTSDLHLHSRTWVLGPAACRKLQRFGKCEAPVRVIKIQCHLRHQAKTAEKDENCVGYQILAQKRGRREKICGYCWGGGCRKVDFHQGWISYPTHISAAYCFFDFSPILAKSVPKWLYRALLDSIRFNSTF